MTVAELIKELEKQPQDLQVEYWGEVLEDAPIYRVSVLQDFFKKTLVCVLD